MVATSVGLDESRAGIGLPARGGAAASAACPPGTDPEGGGGTARPSTGTMRIAASGESEPAHSRRTSASPVTLATSAWSRCTTAGGVRWGQGWETGTAGVNDGAWHHVVLTYNGNVKAAYVDGALDTLTIDQWNSTGTGGQFWIGGGADNGDGTATVSGAPTAAGTSVSNVTVTDSTGATASTSLTITAS